MVPKILASILGAFGVFTSSYGSVFLGAVCCAIAGGLFVYLTLKSFEHNPKQGHVFGIKAFDPLSNTQRTLSVQEVQQILEENAELRKKLLASNDMEEFEAKKGHK
ncbi:hypothetical protein EBR43_04555 [bacterium]|nr:hypothetical protein [bacterium]NBX72107.1 hypothetical protein [bacterium]